MALTAFYCVLLPNQYEASAKVALRLPSGSSLSLSGADTVEGAASVLSAPVQLETMANVLRSEQLAWRVILDQRLYASKSFSWRFAKKFPGFRPDRPTLAEQAYLIDAFDKRLKVQSVPRTLILEIRFRSKDPGLASSVVNALIRESGREELEARETTTTKAENWLGSQLALLKTRMEQNEQRFTAYQHKHNLLISPDDAESGTGVHSIALAQLEETEHALAEASSDHLMKEAAYSAVILGNPEQASGMNSDSDSNIDTRMIEQLRMRRGDLEQEQAQLAIEHGPNYPHVAEIRQQEAEIDRQLQKADASLLARLHTRVQAAANREAMLRQKLDGQMHEAIAQNEAVSTLAMLRQEAQSSRELYTSLTRRAEEAGLNAGLRTGSLTVVDPARTPVKPVAPNPALYLPVALFIGLWMATGAALLQEALA